MTSSPSTWTRGRRIRRGSRAMSWISSSGPCTFSRLIPEALAVGLFQEKISRGDRSPRMARISWALSGCRKISRSSNGTPCCARNSRALRQVLQPFRS